MYYMAQRSASFSARFEPSLLQRLDRRKHGTRESRSTLAERYIDEGLRMDAHPGIVFRDGPMGRRAALAAGPDVWELVSFLRDLDSKGDAAIREVAEMVNLSESQVRTALGYYADYPDEIDDRIRADEEAADVAEAAWRRQQAALS